MKEKRKLEHQQSVEDFRLQLADLLEKQTQFERQIEEDAAKQLAQYDDGMFLYSYLLLSSTLSNQR